MGNFPTHVFFKNMSSTFQKLNSKWCLFQGLAFVFSNFSSKIEMLIFDTMLVAVASGMTA